MPTPLRVLAVDPGLTTGYAVWLRTFPEEFAAGEFEQPASFLKWAAEIVGSIDVCVCESFRQDPKLTRQDWSLEIIGALRDLCLNSGITFVLQSPADAKLFSTNEKLHRIGWWSVGKGHSRDAARHLLLYAVKNRLVDPAVFLP